MSDNRVEVHVNDGSAHDTAMAWSQGHTDGWNEALDAIRAIPAVGRLEGVNRYDTDTMHILHIWHDGRSWDISVPKAPLRGAADRLEEAMG